MSFPRFFPSPPLKKLSVFVMTHGEVPDSFTMNFPDTYAVIREIQNYFNKIGIVSQPEEIYIYNKIQRILSSIENQKTIPKRNPIVCKNDYGTQIPPYIKVYDMTLLGQDNLSNNEWEKSLISLTNEMGYDYFINTERDGLNTVFKGHDAELLAIVTKNIGKVYTGKAIMPNYVLSVSKEDKKDDVINIIKIDHAEDHANSKITVDPERVIHNVSRKYNYQNPNTLNFQTDDKPLLQIIENEKYNNNKILLSDYLLLLKDDYNDYDITVYLLNCRPLPKFDTVINFFIFNKRLKMYRGDILASSKFQQWLTYYIYVDKLIEEQNIIVFKKTAVAFIQDCIKICQDIITIIQKLKKTAEDNKIASRLENLQKNLSLKGQNLNFKTSVDGYDYKSFDGKDEIFGKILKVLESRSVKLEMTDSKKIEIPNNEYKSVSFISSCKNQIDSFISNMTTYYNDLFNIPENYNDLFNNPAKRKVEHNSYNNNSEYNNVNSKRTKRGGNPTKRKSKPSKNKKSKKKTRKQRKCLVLYAKK